MYSHNDQLLKLASREKKLDFVHFLKLKVPQLHFPIHLNTKADEVSEMNGIFSLRKCIVCKIFVTTMTIRLTQLSEFFKLECNSIYFGSLYNPNKMYSRSACCSEIAAMRSLCFVDLRVTVNVGLIQW
jgi:hypothetical protein